MKQTGSYAVKSSSPPTEKTLIIGGERHMPHILAQCCHPHFPEDVVAVMRSGGKCMVHSQRCYALHRVNPARLLPAYWSTQQAGLIVPLIIVIQDRPGFLADITKTLYHSGVNIVDIHTKTAGEGIFEIAIRIEIPSDE